MKMTMVCTEYPPNYRGGLGIYLERLVTSLKKENHEVEVYAMNYPHALPKRTVEGSAVINRISPCSFTRKGLDKYLGKRSLPAILYNAISIAFFNFHAFLKIRRASKKNDVGVIGIHDWMCIPAALLIHWFTKLDMMFHVHSTEMSMNLHQTGGVLPRVAAWLENRMKGIAKKVVVPSQEVKVHLIADGWQPDIIYVVPHGHEDANLEKVIHASPTKIEADKLRLRTEWAVDPDTKLIAFAGRLTPHKGIETLIDAMATVKSRVGDCKLIVIGSGEEGYQEKLQQRIDSQGLSQHVFAYFQQLSQDQVFERLNAVDICVFPSVYEPFGFVALEAMSLSKPVVLGSGFPTIIKDPKSLNQYPEDTALFAQTDDANEIASHLIELLNSPEKRSSLGQSAKTYALTHFKWSKTAQMTTNVYQTV